MHMNKLPLVTIQILNWNRAEETLRAIESALNQTYPNIEIIVIDNNSTDNSINKIKSQYPEIKLVQLDKNYGCPGGRNRGISFCKGEYVFFCDNDGVLHKDAVKNALECILKDDNIAIVTGLVKNFVSEEEIDTDFQLPKPTYTYTSIFQGGITLHKKSIYTDIDMYPDDYMYGSEETYLALRVLDAGFSIVKSNQVILWHKKSELARNSEKESLQAWGNKLATSYQLYPLENFIKFFCYFWVVYPYYAIKNGFFKGFIMSSINYLKRFKKYKRKPVKRKTYKTFIRLHNQ